MSNYTVTVREKRSNGKSVGYEGIVSVPGLRPTKLTRKDGTTLFGTPSAISSSVRSLSSRTKIGFNLVTSAKAAKQSNVAK